MNDLTPDDLPVLGSKVIVHPDPPADWAEGWPGKIVDVNTSRFSILGGDYQVDLTGHGPVWFGLDEIEVVADA